LPRPVAVHHDFESYVKEFVHNLFGPHINPAGLHIEQTRLQSRLQEAMKAREQHWQQSAEEWHEAETFTLVKEHEAKMERAHREIKDLESILSWTREALKASEREIVTLSETAAAARETKSLQAAKAALRRAREREAAQRVVAQAAEQRFGRDAAGPERAKELWAAQQASGQAAAEAAAATEQATAAEAAAADAAAEAAAVSAATAQQEQAAAEQQAAADRMAADRAAADLMAAERMSAERTAAGVAAEVARVAAAKAAAAEAAAAKRAWNARAVADEASAERAAAERAAVEEASGASSSCGPAAGTAATAAAGPSGGFEHGRDPRLAPPWMTQNRELLAGLHAQSSAEPKAGFASTSESITSLLTLEELEAALARADARGRLLCVKYYVPWCTTCLKMQPLYEEVAEGPFGEHVDFCEVDGGAARVLLALASPPDATMAGATSDEAAGVWRMPATHVYARGALRETRLIQDKHLFEEFTSGLVDLVLKYVYEGSR